MELPEDTQRLSTKNDTHRERVHSLFTSSALHKGAFTNPDNTPGKGSEFPSAYNTQAQGKKLPPKEKESTGNRLLNMLRQTFHGSDSEEQVVARETRTLVPFGDVVGCLAVRIKSCRQLVPKISVHQDNLFVRISVNTIVKCTKTYHLTSSSNEKNPVIIFSDVKYFTIQVPRRQEDERNKILLELMQYVNSENIPFLLGSVEVHLYEVIQKGCFTEELHMLKKNKFVCKLDVEFMFTYGNFGYGFSHQLKPLQKLIEPSMFMKITPPPERTDPQTNVITPQPIGYPAFLSQDLNVTVGTQTDKKHSIQTPIVQLEKLQQQPRERLKKMKSMYRNMQTWTEKAAYLESIINPKMETKDSKKVSITDKFESWTQVLEEPETKTLDVPVTYKASETTAGEVSFPTIPILEITEDDEVIPLGYETEAMPEENEKKVSILTSGGHLKAPQLCIYTDTAGSSQAEVTPYEQMGQVISCYLEDLIYDKTPDQKHVNKKGRNVAFSGNEFITPSSRQEYVELTTKFKKFQLGNFDHFLRNVSKEKPVSKKEEDQDIYKCISTLSPEIVEHEDQDPPYSKSLQTEGSSKSKNICPNPRVQMFDTKRLFG
ncbi:cation channel sperm-associated targeting subunit tau isoform X3 [Dipodomys merriami]|uniref:cation channel sperm-associated targeting subunit tau isoform X3 n=1 Tax=Dipodomys merriami TaxID=94247 RepID=UPI003856085C